MDSFLVNTGRKQFFIVSSFIILASLYTIGIYIYYSTLHGYYLNYIKSEIVLEVFYLAVVLYSLISVYKGRKWGMYFLIGFFSYKIYYALGSISWFYSIKNNLLGRITYNYSLNFDIVIYCIAILYFCFSKSFKEFIKYQKTKFTRVQSRNN
ncbi:hypothetical protein [Tenacibaculum jejuense]|nr:hypothetical protein [Tenacibaculum jejuense]